MPKIKTIDFLNGLFKMFNLTAYYDGIEIVVKTLNSYYQSGNEYSLTKYVDTSDSEIKRNDLYSQIDMKFAKSSTFAAQNANEIQSLSKDFGNEKLNNVNSALGQEFSLAFDGGKYEVKVPFEKVMYERMSNQATQNLTTYQWGWFCSKDENPVLGKPLLFYPIKRQGELLGVYNGNPSYWLLFDKNVKLSGNNPWQNWTDDSGDAEAKQNTQIIRSYIMPSNNLKDSSQSIHFGSELNEYTFKVEDESLFDTYWSNYISNIYNKRIFFYLEI